MNPFASQAVGVKRLRGDQGEPDVYNVRLEVDGKPPVVVAEVVNNHPCALWDAMASEVLAEVMEKEAHARLSTEAGVATETLLEFQTKEECPPWLRTFSEKNFVILPPSPRDALRRLIPRALPSPSYSPTSPGESPPPSP